MCLPKNHFCSERWLRMIQFLHFAKANKILICIVHAFLVRTIPPVAELLCQDIPDCSGHKKVNQSTWQLHWVCKFSENRKKQHESTTSFTVNWSKRQTLMPLQNELIIGPLSTTKPQWEGHNCVIWFLGDLVWWTRILWDFFWDMINISTLLPRIMHPPLRLPRMPKLITCIEHHLMHATLNFSSRARGPRNKGDWC